MKNTKKRKNRRSGFTLVEAVIAIMLIVMIGASAITLTMYSNSVYNDTDNRFGARVKASSALAAYQFATRDRDFRAIMGVSDIQAAGAESYSSEYYYFRALRFTDETNTVEFIDFDGNTIFTLDYPHDEYLLRKATVTANPEQYPTYMSCYKQSNSNIFRIKVNYALNTISVYLPQFVFNSSTDYYFDYFGDWIECTFYWYVDPTTKSTIYRLFTSDDYYSAIKLENDAWTIEEGLLSPDYSFSEYTDVLKALEILKGTILPKVKTLIESKSHKITYDPSTYKEVFVEYQYADHPHLSSFVLAHEKNNSGADQYYLSYNDDEENEIIRQNINDIKDASGNVATSKSEIFKEKIKEMNLGGYIESESNTYVFKFGNYSPTKALVQTKAEGDESCYFFYDGTYWHLLTVDKENNCAYYYSKDGTKNYFKAYQTKVANTTATFTTDASQAGTLAAMKEEIAGGTKKVTDLTMGNKIYAGTMIAADETSSDPILKKDHTLAIDVVNRTIYCKMSVNKSIVIKDWTDTYDLYCADGDELKFSSNSSSKTMSTGEFESAFTLLSGWGEDMFEIVEFDYAPGNVHLSLNYETGTYSFVGDVLNASDQPYINETGEKMEAYSLDDTVSYMIPGYPDALTQIKETGLIYSPNLSGAYYTYAYYSWQLFKVKDTVVISFKEDGGHYYPVFFDEANNEIFYIKNGTKYYYVGWEQTYKQNAVKQQYKFADGTVITNLNNAHYDGEKYFLVSSVTGGSWTKTAKTHTPSSVIGDAKFKTALDSAYASLKSNYTVDGSNILNTVASEYFTNNIKREGSIEWEWDGFSSGYVVKQSKRDNFQSCGGSVSVGNIDYGTAGQVKVSLTVNVTSIKYKEYTDQKYGKFTGSGNDATWNGTYEKTVTVYFNCTVNRNEYSGSTPVYTEKQLATYAIESKNINNANWSKTSSSFATAKDVTNANIKTAAENQLATQLNNKTFDGTNYETYYKQQAKSDFDTKLKKAGEITKTWGTKTINGKNYNEVKSYSIKSNKVDGFTNPQCSITHGNIAYDSNKGQIKVSLKISVSFEYSVYDKTKEVKETVTWTTVSGCNSEEHSDTYRKDVVFDEDQPTAKKEQYDYTVDLYFSCNYSKTYDLEYIYEYVTEDKQYGDGYGWKSQTEIDALLADFAKWESDHSTDTVDSGYVDGKPANTAKNRYVPGSFKTTWTPYSTRANRSEITSLKKDVTISFCAEDDNIYQIYFNAGTATQPDYIYCHVTKDKDSQTGAVTWSATWDGTRYQSNYEYPSFFETVLGYELTDIVYTRDPSGTEISYYETSNYQNSAKFFTDIYPFKNGTALYAASNFNESPDRVKLYKLMEKADPNKQYFDVNIDVDMLNTESIVIMITVPQHNEVNSNDELFLVPETNYYLNVIDKDVTDESGNVTGTQRALYFEKAKEEHTEEGELVLTYPILSFSQFKEAMSLLGEASPIDVEGGNEHNRYKVYDIAYKKKTAEFESEVNLLSTSYNDLSVNYFHSHDGQNDLIYSDDSFESDEIGFTAYQKSFHYSNQELEDPVAVYSYSILRYLGKVTTQDRKIAFVDEKGTRIIEFTYNELKDKNGNVFSDRLGTALSQITGAPDKFTPQYDKSIVLFEEKSTSLQGLKYRTVWNYYPIKFNKSEGSISYTGEYNREYYYNGTGFSTSKHTFNGADYYDARMEIMKKYEFTLHVDSEDRVYFVNSANVQEYYQGSGTSFAANLVSCPSATAFANLKGSGAIYTEVPVYYTFMSQSSLNINFLDGTSAEPISSILLSAQVGENETPIFAQLYKNLTGEEINLLASGADNTLNAYCTEDDYEFIFQKYKSTFSVHNSQYICKVGGYEVSFTATFGKGANNFDGNVKNEGSDKSTYSLQYVK